MIRASISVASVEAGRRELERMIGDLESAGTATWAIEGDACPNVLVEVVNEANDEFEPPSVAVDQRPD